MIDPTHLRRITFFTLVGHTLTHVYMILFSPLLVVMAADLGTDKEGVAVYFTLANSFFGLGAVPAGWLSSRLGDKPLLVAFFIGCALGGTLIGIAGNVWLLAAGSVLLGLATSIYHPVGIALLSKSAARRGLAMGINGIAGSAGVALGPFYAFGVLRAGLSWRWAFLLLGVPSLIFGLWLWAVSLGAAAAPARRVEAAPGGPPAHRARLSPWQAALVVLLLAAMMLGGFNFHLSTALLPGLLTKSGLFSSGLSPEETGALVAGFTLAFGGLGQFLAGYLADRHADRKLYCAVLLLAAPSVLLLAFAGGTALFAWACAASLLMFAAQPIENTLIARYSQPGWRGVFYGWKFVLVFGVGGIGSWAAARIDKWGGIERVYQAGGAALALAFLCALGASLLHGRATAPPAAPAAADRVGAPEPRD